MNPRALNILALLVFGSSSVAYAGKPPTAAANQANVIGIPVSALNPPPAGVTAVQPGVSLQGFGTVAMWRGCYFVEPLTFASDSSYSSLTIGDQMSRPLAEQ